MGSLSNSMSSVVALILSIGVFSGMQLYRHQLAASGPLTVLGGALGALVFLFVLTAIGNLEIVVFGRNFQTGIFEVVICYIVALVASGLIHGVCVTTCFIFSTITLYYINSVSQKTYSTGSAAALHSNVSSGKKRK